VLHIYSVKTVACLTYTVLVGTLNHVQSILTMQQPVIICRLVLAIAYLCMNLEMYTGNNIIWHNFVQFRDSGINYCNLA